MSPMPNNVTPKLNADHIGINARKSFKSYLLDLSVTSVNNDVSTCSDHTFMPRTRQT